MQIVSAVVGIGLFLGLVVGGLVYDLYRDEHGLLRRHR